MNRMNLREWYRGLSERDRKIVAWGGPIGAVLLLAGALLALEVGVNRAEVRVQRRQADLAWLHQVAPRVQSLPAGVSANESLAQLVDRTAREAGLQQSLTGATPRDDGGLEVKFDGAQFDALVAWLTRLQQELGVSIQGATVDRAEAAGAVNASLTLRRG
jgi:general secretion pathway protein M